MTQDEERTTLKVVIQFSSGSRLESDPTDVRIPTYLELRQAVEGGLDTESTSLKLTGLSFNGEISGTLALNPRKIEYIQLVLPDLTEKDVDR